MIARLLYAALVVGLLGLLLVVLPWLGRKARGLGSGKTVALDNVRLFSEVYGLVGRPDRIEQVGRHLIPEEWKSSKKVSHGHKLQLGTYFILIETMYGEPPPYGFVVLGDGSRHKVENTEELRAEVLTIAEKIRERRRVIADSIDVRQPAWKCRMCGQRGNCGQASG